MNNLPGYPFTPKRLAVNGHTLSYLDEGQGPCLVMVHGNPTWSYYYWHLVSALKDRFRVIVPDHLGCGFSDKPEDHPYQLADHIANLERLLDQLGVKKCSLVLHDWGGAIGMGYATRRSDSIRSLVILNTAAFRSQRIPLRIGICKVPVLGEILVRGANAFAWPATFMAVSHKMAPEVCKAYLKPYGSWRERVAIHHFVKDIPLNSSHPSWSTLVAVEEGLTQLTDTPMLVLWGGKDFCFNDHFYLEWLARFPKAEHHHFADCGHYILEDGHGEVEPLIGEFLTRN